MDRMKQLKSLLKKKKIIEIKLAELKLELRKTNIEIDNIVSDPR